MTPLIHPPIAELKDLIDILNVTSPYSTNGEGTITSIHGANIWANVIPLGGDLIEETQQHQQYSQRYNIWIRSLNGVTAFQQINWNGTRLIMTGPPEDFGSWMLLHAEERTSRHL